MRLVIRVEDARTTETQTDENPMIDRRRTMTTMDAEMAMTQDAVRTTATETSRKRIANPEKATQMGVGEEVEMTQINRQTTIQNADRITQRKTKRRAANP
jgi:Cu2+-containing amine oxidase